MARLKDSVAGVPGEKAESLMVINRIQSPGMAILDDTGLTLVPLVGKTISIAFGDIEYAKETAWLPGKKLIYKKAFHLGVRPYSRLAFAVTEDVFQRWRIRLKDPQTK